MFNTLSYQNALLMNEKNNFFGTHTSDLNNLVVVKKQDHVTNILTDCVITRAILESVSNN